MPDASAALSPYEAVLGDGLADLHPRLAAYFAAIPAGSRGHGEGVFERVGTPRRWLWPVYRALQAQGVLFPGWHRAVGFTIINTPALDEHGRVTVTAVRRFAFAGGTRDMIDAITAVDTATGPNIVDFLGRSRLLECTLAAGVADGALHLHSTALSFRLGSLRLRIPAAIAPRVRLTERYDERDGAQHVTVEVDAPVLGRLYEYAGSFSYEIRRGKSEL